MTPPNVSAEVPADAWVVFGATGNLAHKMIFPALYAMCKRGLRSGKHLPVTACEVVVRLKAPPQNLFADSAVREDANDLRFHVSPRSTIALGARVKRPGKEFVGEQREFMLLDEEPDEQAPYERLLTDAMNGDGAWFAREGAIEAAWAAVAPVLVERPSAAVYVPGSWGPPAANHFIAADGGWCNPDPAP